MKATSFFWFPGKMATIDGSKKRKKNNFKCIYLTNLVQSKFTEHSIGILNLGRKALAVTETSTHMQFQTQ